MAREFTQQELQAFQQALDALRDNGLDVDYEGSNRNADILIEHFQTTTVTVAAVYQLVEQRKNEFIWRTSAQFNWDKASVSLTLKDRQQIIDYVNRSQHLKSDGDNLYVKRNSVCQMDNRAQGTSSELGVDGDADCAVSVPPGNEDASSGLGT
jgi:hypothetical protein